MIIRVTDANHMYVPRFCYHEKLTVAANCRMCLVEVEKAPKPLPACATPVAEGMKVFTKSAKAIGAQRAVMEFLLINHPLDCPICDQGGECELQDISMGFGRDISRFQERKRSVADENLGPLIATDMTRCIHCTRCIRFTQEIAGYQELGMVGRGENMKVRTYIEQTVNHEMSGNVIDLCPVGALVSKPYRFSARAWEMLSHPLVSPHDGVGTNLYGHVLRGRVMRMIPRENEAINEIWIPDRDRFSYEGIYSPDRIQKPMLRQGNDWIETTWETALAKVAEGLRSRSADLGVLASTTSTLEELYLLGRVTRGLGSANIDHRLRQRDFRDQDADPVHPALGLPIADIEKLNGLLVIGSNLRREVPIIAHRVRKAALKGTKVVSLVPGRVEYLFPLAAEIVSSPARQVEDLAAILAVAAEKSGKPVPGHLASAVQQAKVNDTHRAAVAALTVGEHRAVWLGALALRHPAFADLRALAAAIAEATGASFGVLAEGGNAVGAYLAGAVPHREAGGKPTAKPGLSALEMVRRTLKAYVLFGGVEPWVDSAEAEGSRSLAKAEFVVAITPFANEQLKDIAHVLLPIGTFVETSGTYVSLEGRWQSHNGAAPPVGEARPGWNVLRVLGNLLNLSGFDYQSSEEVREELRKLCAESPTLAYKGSHSVGPTPPGAEVVEVSMYHVDALVRRAPSLQKTSEGRTLAVTLT
jgi:NADH-quinone oxidoreductase subunit G